MNEKLTHDFAHSGNENGIWTTLKLKRLIVSENMNSIFFADISRSFFQCFRRSNQSSLQSFSRNISWNEKRIVKMPPLKLIVVEFGNISWSHGVATIPRKFRLINSSSEGDQYSQVWVQRHFLDELSEIASYLHSLITTRRSLCHVSMLSSSTCETLSRDCLKFSSRLRRKDQQYHFTSDYN